MAENRNFIKLIKKEDNYTKTNYLITNQNRKSFRFLLKNVFKNLVDIKNRAIFAQLKKTKVLAFKNIQHENKIFIQVLNFTHID